MFSVLLVALLALVSSFHLFHSIIQGQLLEHWCVNDVGVIGYMTVTKMLHHEHLFCQHCFPVSSKVAWPDYPPALDTCLISRLRADIQISGWLVCAGCSHSNCRCILYLWLLLFTCSSRALDVWKPTYPVNTNAGYHRLPFLSKGLSCRSFLAFSTPPWRNLTG